MSDINKIYKERELAERLFDNFRDIQCIDGQGVMENAVKFSLVKKLNPLERKTIWTVIDGLRFLEYIDYSVDGFKRYILTKKGFKYIYDEEKVAKMLQTPWFIPDMENPDWAKAQKRLLKYICDEGGAYYLDAKTFYDFVAKIDSNYANKTFDSHAAEFVKLYKDENTSSPKYFECLINSLTNEQRIELYVNIQKYFEDRILDEDND